MEARTKAMAWAVCLLASVTSPRALASEATPVPAGAACNVSNGAGPAARQEWAVARSGKIPGIGTVHGTIGWDGRKIVRLAGDQFSVSRTFDPVSREVEVTISGESEEPLVIRLGGASRLRVAKAGRTIDISNVHAVRGALDGRAIAAFRERIGNYERRLIAGGPSGRADQPHADAFLLVGAFLSSLAGDPTAVARARDLIVQRIQGKLRAARLEFEDCVTDYELYLLKIDTQRTNCLDAANDRETWYARAADRLACEAEFMAQAISGEGQFISCTALGTLM